MILKRFWYPQEDLKEINARLGQKITEDFKDKTCLFWVFLKAVCFYDGSCKKY